MTTYHTGTDLENHGLNAIEAMDRALPAGAGFLMVVCGSLLFWLVVIFLFVRA